MSQSWVGSDLAGPGPGPGELKRQDPDPEKDPENCSPPPFFFVMKVHYLTYVQLLTLPLFLALTL